MTETPVDTDTDARGNAATAAVLEAVVRADHMINALTAVRAGLIEVLRTATIDPHIPDLPGDPDVEMDLRSVTAELACALHVPHTTAANLMDTAHILATELPATAAALADGTITYRHATTMVTFISGLDPHLRTRAETTLIPRAKILTVSAFTRAATRERDRLNPAPRADRHAHAATGRTVLLEPDIDGMSWLHAHLPSPAATAIFHRLSDAAATLAHPDDPRTLPQLRADTLAALTLDDDARDALNHVLAGATGPEPGASTEQGPGGCHQHRDTPPRTRDGYGDFPDSDDTHGTGARAPADAGGDEGSAEDRARRRLDDNARRMRQTLRGIRPTVAVTVPVLTLLGGDAPAELDGYGPIDADTARQLCATAPSFLRILTHPHTGAILGVDRNRYTVPADLKAWLRLRDATCRFPGCARRATRCDLDHVTDWAHGGTTDQTNLIHLCRTHHRLRHTTRWKAQLTTYPPDTDDPTASPRPDGQGSERDQRGSQTPADSRPTRLTTGPLGASVRWTAPSGRTYTTIDALTAGASGDDREPYPRFPDTPPV